MEGGAYLNFLPHVVRVVRNIGSMALTLGLTFMLCAAAKPPTLVVQWNNVALQADRDSSFGPPMVARAGNRPYLHL